MQNLYGIKGVSIKLFHGREAEVNSNRFLKEYDGDIIDVKLQDSETGLTVMIIYKK